MPTLRIISWHSRHRHQRCAVHFPPSLRQWCHVNVGRIYCRHRLTQIVCFFLSHMHIAHAFGTYHEKWTRMLYFSMYFSRKLSCFSHCSWFIKNYLCENGRMKQYNINKFVRAPSSQSKAYLTRVLETHIIYFSFVNFNFQIFAKKSDQMFNIWWW